MKGTKRFDLHLAVTLVAICSVALVQAEAQQLLQPVEQPSSRIETLINEGRRRGEEKAQKHVKKGSKESETAPLSKQSLDCSMLSPQDAIECNFLPIDQAHKKYFAELTESAALRKMNGKIDDLENKLAIAEGLEEGTTSPASRDTKIIGARTIYAYDENRIYEVRSAPFQFTVIQFEKDERILSTDVADKKEWLIDDDRDSSEIDRHYITVKPTVANLDSGLWVVTSKRSYYLRLISGDTHMPIVSWDIPSSKPKTPVKKKVSPKEASTRSQGLKFDPEMYSSNYEVEEKDYIWRPRRVFNDGKWTYIELDPKAKYQESPSLYLIHDGEVEFVQDISIEGEKKNYLVIHRLFEEAILKVRERTVKIVNRDLKKSEGLLGGMF
jgi:type IV secretory pathway VirB9-like protein